MITYLAHLQGTNPIYNLLPDIFSSLSAETNLPSGHFQVCIPTPISWPSRAQDAHCCWDT